MIKIVYYSETVDNWGRTESSKKPEVIEEVLRTPAEWSDDMLFEDENGKTYFIDDLVGDTVQVGLAFIKIEDVE